MFILLFILIFVFALYAQMRVSSTYRRNAQIESRGRLTGREAAEAVMAQAGITDVEVVEIGGFLTDHYDPIKRRLSLCSANYRGTNLAAIGVAAHESGHAIQHKIGYKLLTARMALVPATQFVSRALPIIWFGAVFFFVGYTPLMLDLLIACYAVMTLFQLVTLPVEYDASRRAKTELVRLGILQPAEMPGVNQTLDAAALTYLAAFIGSLLYLLYFLSGRRR
ncbi:MAG TPA: zinc metallopeptidase [Opitutaceae bacterium]|jgi:hypothetical protein